MKILNLKMNLPVIIVTVVVLLLLLMVILFASKHATIHMTTQNYTKILRDSHQDISKFLGKTIHTSGYVFRGKDFAKDNFVIARDMLISESEANIVGFLCSYEQANDFENNEWVEATGVITLGDYYGPIPVLKITTIRRITTPNDIYVNPPK